MVMGLFSYLFSNEKVGSFIVDRDINFLLLNEWLVILCSSVEFKVIFDCKMVIIFILFCLVIKV